MGRRHILVFASLWILALAAPAGTPREVWVKAKCALCHGIDGSSQTDAGRQTKAPDLRADATQELTGCGRDDCWLNATAFS